MSRITTSSLLLGGLLFAAVGCNPPPTDSATNSDPNPAVSNPTTTPGDNGMQGGENYTITVLDTTIKSPRKELRGTVDGVGVTVNYGSPSVNERTIYGDLVPYGKVWRTGANEATRITFDQAVVVGEEGTPLEAGTYSLFTMPADRDNWTIIFNKTAEQWGAYDYDESADAARVTGTAAALSSPAEQMDFALEGDEVVLMWSDLQVGFPVAAAAR